MSNQRVLTNQQRRARGRRGRRGQRWATPGVSSTFLTFSEKGLPLRRRDRRQQARNQTKEV